MRVHYKKLEESLMGETLHSYNNVTKECGPELPTSLPQTFLNLSRGKTLSSEEYFVDYAS